MPYCTSITYTGHALRRMFERGLTEQEVAAVLRTGVMLIDYPDDRPYPSQLRLGWVNSKAIHVVVSQNPETGACYLITVYY
ncbi:MAG: DUF4258 domain-containing protein, partial [Marinospirillum sp.]|uniref:DUF4258 domain-containing protein n=1 Tax=Marinospirillum sp. TaxID=2183934 RepID=UPI0019F9980C